MIVDRMEDSPEVAANGVVEVVAVTRRFKQQVAVDDVSFALPGGTVHALLGPNGAGKTTLLRLVAGLMRPTAGAVTVLGGDPQHSEARSRIGWLPSGDRSFYLRISGRENLAFFARLHGISRADSLGRAGDLLERVGLGEAGDRMAGLYSHGMLKRLGVARALITDPDVLLVDEATHDLDPEGSRLVRELVTARARAGAAVIWSSHRLEELPGFVDSVTVLDRGKMRFHGPLRDMLAGIDHRFYHLTVEARDSAGTALEQRLAASVEDVGTLVGASGEEEGGFLVRLSPGFVLGDLLGRVLEAGFVLRDCREEGALMERALQATLERP